MFGDGRLGGWCFFWFGEGRRSLLSSESFSPGCMDNLCWMTGECWIDGIDDEVTLEALDFVDEVAKVSLSYGLSGQRTIETIVESVSIAE